MRGRDRRSRGQTSVEFIIAWGTLVLPMTLAIIFTCSVLWTWHGVNEYTRQGADYAATHCWQSTATNVLDYMRTNVPPVINQEQFRSGPAEISVAYFGKDAATGQLIEFQCDTECSPNCIPDAVTIRVRGVEYRGFFTSLGLPPIVMPDFATSLPMESAGCDPEQGSCLP